jgi:hypothetical protein
MSVQQPSRVLALGTFDGASMQAITNRGFTRFERFFKTAHGGWVFGLETFADDFIDPSSLAVILSPLALNPSRFTLNYSYGYNGGVPANFLVVEAGLMTPGEATKTIALTDVTFSILVFRAN